MTQDQFYTWLEHPTEMNMASIAHLREVVRQYPYFQAAQAMLAKNLKQENHIDQLNQLQLAAIMVPDRKLFHDYLHDKLVTKARAKELEEEKPKTEAISRNIERSSLYDLIPEPIVYRLETADLPELILHAAKNRPTIVPEPESLSFSEWLDFVSNKELNGDPLASAMLEASKAESVRSSIDMIDQFLTKQSTGAIKRMEFFNPQKVGAKSTLEDFTVVSETLARIYFEQEKYDLARQAYQALSLKYPEKSVYFAARLKEIDEKPNTEN